MVSVGASVSKLVSISWNVNVDVAKCLLVCECRRFGEILGMSIWMLFGVWWSVRAEICKCLVKYQC